MIFWSVPRHRCSVCSRISSSRTTTTSGTSGSPSDRDRGIGIPQRTTVCAIACIVHPIRRGNLFLLLRRPLLSHEFVHCIDRLGHLGLEALHVQWYEWVPFIHSFIHSFNAMRHLVPKFTSCVVFPRIAPNQSTVEYKKSSEIYVLVCEWMNDGHAISSIRK